MKFLYRADNIFNNELLATNPEAGLFSRLIKQGDPLYLEKVNLRKALAAHVNPIHKETAGYMQSHFLSFTEDREIAFRYLQGEKGDELIRSGGNTTHYLFRLDIGLKKETTNRGVYELKYQCTLARGGGQNCLHGYAEHNALLFNLVELIGENREFHGMHDILAIAKRDAEWLVLPYDPMDDLVGHSARIYPTEILTNEPFETVHSALMGI